MNAAAGGRFPKSGFAWQTRPLEGPAISDDFLLKPPATEEGPCFIMKHSRESADSQGNPPPFRPRRACRLRDELPSARAPSRLNWSGGQRVVNPRATPSRGRPAVWTVGGADVHLRQQPNIRRRVDRLERTPAVPRPPIHHGPGLRLLPDQPADLRLREAARLADVGPHAARSPAGGSRTPPASAARRRTRGRTILRRSFSVVRAVANGYTVRLCQGIAMLNPSCSSAHWGTNRAIPCVSKHNARSAMLMCCNRSRR